MRYREIHRRTDEAFLTGFEEPFRKNYVEVYKNPTAKEYRSIAKDSEVRAFLIGDDLIAWSPYDALHHTVREQLDIPKDAIPLNLWMNSGGVAMATVTDNTQYTPLFHSPDLEEIINNHRYFSRLGKVVDVSYFDEDIVGPWHELTDEVNEGIDDERDDTATRVARVIRQMKRFTARLPINMVLKPYVNRYGGDVQGIVLTDLFAEKPGEGAGTKAMTKLCALADQEDLNVYTDPDTRRADAFYRRFGFVDGHHAGHYLVRYPPLELDD